MSLFHALHVRLSQGKQFIADVRTAVPTGFRGKPAFGGAACPPDCEACIAACPTTAIRRKPLGLDLGRCVFCSECVSACPEAKISFGPDPHMGASAREDLWVSPAGPAGPAGADGAAGAAGAEDKQEPGGSASTEARTRVRANATFAKLFGRSLRLRQVSAGGCNACELELNATANVNFDLQRFGIEWVASPRHADALVLSGTLTRTMRDAVRLCWEAMPDPRFVIAVGACAISGGLYQGASGVDRGFLDQVTPALYVSGCPPHPLTFVNAILDLLGVA
jgi:Ni,Fe-hydrogenase III small subunit/ferredoxin